MKCNLISLRI